MIEGGYRRAAFSNSTGIFFGIDVVVNGKWMDHREFLPLLFFGNQGSWGEMLKRNLGEEIQWMRKVTGRFWFFATELEGSGSKKKILVFSGNRRGSQEMLGD